MNALFDAARGQRDHLLRRRASVLTGNLGAVVIAGAAGKARRTSWPPT